LKIKWSCLKHERLQMSKQESGAIVNTSSLGGLVGVAGMKATETEAMNQSMKEMPIGRLGQPGEIAAAVLWRCSPGASYVIDHALVVDGGHTVR
jgi:NAD(P)-dependent dehydrogenase (short-subunit alcohol dehydrogenase family)